MKKKQSASLKAKKNAMMDRVLKERGFRYGLHRILTEGDWECMQKFEEWVEFVYTKERHLDRRVKELIITAIILTLRSSPEHVQAHMKAAAKAGATKEELIVVTELVGHWAGTVAFANGLECWRYVFAPDLPPAFKPLPAGQRA